ALPSRGGRSRATRRLPPGDTRRALAATREPRRVRAPPSVWRVRVPPPHLPERRAQSRRLPLEATGHGGQAVSAAPLQTRGQPRVREADAVVPPRFLSLRVERFRRPRLAVPRQRRR